MCVSPTEKTVGSETVLHTSVHGYEVLALEVESPINDLDVRLVNIPSHKHDCLTNIMTHFSKYSVGGMEPTRQGVQVQILDSAGRIYRPI